MSGSHEDLTHPQKQDSKKSIQEPWKIVIVFKEITLMARDSRNEAQFQTLADRRNAS